MFKQVTGFACPSCGITRSLLQILEGDFATALAINPLGFLAAIFLFVFPFLVSYQIAFRKPIVRDCFNWFEQILKYRLVAGILIVVVLANWYWNITKGL